MKKITLLTLLITLPLLGFSQGPWEFNNTDDGWVKGGGCTAATGATAWILTTNGGNNPNFTNTSAGVDADANQYAAVTIRVSAGGPSYMRLRFPKTGGGFVYRPVVIDPSETDFVTYYIDASNADWTGTVNDIRFQFKNNDGSTAGATHTSNGETIEIDRVEFISSIPRAEKLEYEFDTDGDFEGFDALVDANASVASGVLTLTPDGNGPGKVTNNTNSVNADANSHVHIIYKNNSPTNNQVRFQFRSSVDGYVSFIGSNATINQSMSTFETLTIDIETAKPVEWSGTAQDMQVAVRNTGNAGNAASADGTFEIDRIVFNNSMTLTVEELETTNFSIYPNPARNIINITSSSEIELVRIYDITGKLVLPTKVSAANSIDVSQLKAGVYLFNVILSNGNQVTKRLVKQ